MRVEHFQTPSGPFIDHMVHFEPWPFADNFVAVKDARRITPDGGGLLTPALTTQYQLSRDHPILVEFNDRTMATTNVSGLRAWLDRVGQAGL